MNRAVVAANKRNGTRRAPITARNCRGRNAGHVAVIRDPNGNELARCGYWPETPLRCGATVWIETEHTVEVLETPTPHEGSRP